jgi:hypothetical protein
MRVNTEFFSTGTVEADEAASPTSEITKRIPMIRENTTMPVTVANTYLIKSFIT